MQIGFRSAGAGPVIGRAPPYLRPAEPEANVKANLPIPPTARLFLLPRGHPIRPLTPEQVADLRRRFPID